MEEMQNFLQKLGQSPIGHRTQMVGLAWQLSLSATLSVLGSRQPIIYSCVIFSPEPGSFSSSPARSPPGSNWAQHRLRGLNFASLVLSDNNDAGTVHLTTTDTQHGVWSPLRMLSYFLAICTELIDLVVELSVVESCMHPYFCLTAKPYTDIFVFLGSLGPLSPSVTPSWVRAHLRQTRFGRPFARFFIHWTAQRLATHFVVIHKVCIRTSAVQYADAFYWQQWVLVVTTSISVHSKPKHVT